MFGATVTYYIHLPQSITQLIEIGDHELNAQPHIQTPHSPDKILIDYLLHLCQDFFTNKISVNQVQYSN